MSGFAVVDDRYDRRIVRRRSGWARDYLWKAALADFGCAIIGVFAAAQLRFGNGVTGTYIALSLALPVLWLAALWLAGAFDIRFIGTGSDEFHKVLNAGVGLTAALALVAEAERLGFEVMIGGMVGTSLGVAPALLLAGKAKFVDLDGPLLLAKDRADGLRYEGSLVYPAAPALWG